LCDNTKGIFYSNPFNEGDESANEFLLNLKCEVIFMDYTEYLEETDFKDSKDFKQAVIHYYMDKEIEPMIKNSKFTGDELKD